MKSVSIVLLALLSIAWTQPAFADRISTPMDTGDKDCGKCQVWSASKKKCVCKSGYVWSKSKKACVRKKKK